MGTKAATFAWLMLSLAVLPLGYSAGADDSSQEEVRATEITDVGFAPSCTTVICSDTTYQLRNSPPDNEAIRLYSQLTEPQKALFQNNRLLVLSSVARLLNSKSSLLGRGLLLKNRLLQIIKRGESGPSITHMELGRNSIQRVMDAIDKEFWMHSSLVANSKEFGLSLQISAGGGIAFGKKGFFGQLGPIGLSIGYNTESKQLVFDYFMFTNKLDAAYPVIAQGGLFGEAALYMSAPNRSLLQTGKYLSPPGPFSLITTNEYFSVGISQIIGLPPPGTGSSLFSYGATYKRLSLLRMTFGKESPMVAIRTALLQNPEIFRFLHLSKLTKGIVECFRLFLSLGRAHIKKGT